MSLNNTPPVIPLTSLAHGGGCGCKIAPGVLSEILKNITLPIVPKELLAGTDNNEDAAVYQINDSQAIIATTDFFTPIVDNPFDFGKIAATNAISDIYAMGATPIFALAILGMPINLLPLEVIQQITEGGAFICQQAGIPIAGGHSIDTVEPIYGLVVLGIIDPKKLKRNSTAKVDDKIVLGKPLGIGILSAALKKGLLDESSYQEMLKYSTQLNTPGIKLSELEGVHAMTDVTGFGLAGHLLEMCKGSQVRAQVDFQHLPILASAQAFAKQGIFTGASTRNFDGYGSHLDFGNEIPYWQRHLLTDPQTSGGLLVACDPAFEEQVLTIFHQSEFEFAKTIGVLGEGHGIQFT